ncbi:MAG: methylmalonyl Co-A mutase-associated GTPase MeaB [Planctomycetota bacterium]
MAGHADQREDLFGLSVSRAAESSTSLGAGPSRGQPISVVDIARGVAAGDRAMLGRAITLVESSSTKHRARAAELLRLVLAETAARPPAIRVGVTGVPGVGKSTFIDRLGSDLTRAGRRVAVLAVDPSSTVTGGSILGDKTRMAQLSVDDRAFIRPSPSAGTLGGVASKTRESMILCEAAGYDVVLVETVGVGQSETTVAEMTDFFLALMLPGAGDELQGIKRGILELADLIAVNKADGDNVARAKRAAAEYRSAIRCMRSRDDGWEVTVLTCSATTGDGIVELWARVEGRVRALAETGSLTERRATQSLRWMRAMVEERVREMVWGDDAVSASLAAIEAEVSGGLLAPTVGAERMIDAITNAWSARSSVSRPVPGQNS